MGGNANYASWEARQALSEARGIEGRLEERIIALEERVKMLEAKLEAKSKD